jgi:hypothetical protein
MATDWLVNLPSSFGPKETMDRLETEIKAKGIIVFARIDHAMGAAPPLAFVGSRRAPHRPSRGLWRLP